MWESATGEWLATHDYTEAPAECDTTRCVAGWAVWLQNPTQPISRTLNELPDSSYSLAGMRLLGLTPYETNYLFFETENSEALAMVEHYAENGREGWEFPYDY